MHNLYEVTQTGDAVTVTFNDPHSLNAVLNTRFNNWKKEDFALSDPPYGGHFVNGWLPELAVRLAMGQDYDEAAEAAANDDYSKTDIDLNGVTVQVKSTKNEQQYHQYFPNIRDSMAAKTLSNNDLVVWCHQENIKMTDWKFVTARSGREYPVKVPARIDKEAPVTVVIKHAMWTEGVDLADVPTHDTGRTTSYMFHDYASPAVDLDVFTTTEPKENK